MKLKRKAIGSVVVVGIEGKLVGGPENAEQFHSFFKTVLDEGHREVVVDLGRTPWANSQGVGMLIGVRMKTANLNGDLVLARVNDRMKDLLTAMQLPLMFKTYETVDEAVKSFSRGHATSLD
jgi:anti-anti-sigma factor